MPLNTGNENTLEALPQEPPIVAISASSAIQSNAMRIALEVGSGSLKKPGTVLVVDDNESNRDILARRLRRQGHVVVLAENGREALRVAEQEEFDLILLDVMMPELDGVGALKELKRNPGLRHIPVIMISAVDEIETVVRCIELGAEDYLPKPFNPTLLRARTDALLERKRLRDEEQRKTAELKEALEEISRQTQRAEHLLLNLLPKVVADELCSNGSVEPMYFEDTTIAFVDFVGFTLATEKLSAEELVQVLHEYFSAFDGIVARYGLEKLKTIGDAYMFAGGLPTRCASHPVDTVLAAMDMVHAAGELGTRMKDINWKLRVGIHSGPVIAGVVGIHKFAFDIWGESVNFAARMESSGAPNRINLSASTYVRVKDFFACEPRGRIKTKEAREFDMYFANSVAPRHLTNAEQSCEASFRRLYRRYFGTDLKFFPPFISSTGAQTYTEEIQSQP